MITKEDFELKRGPKDIIFILQFFPVFPIYEATDKHLGDFDESKKLHLVEVVFFIFDAYEHLRENCRQKQESAVDLTCVE